MGEGAGVLVLETLEHAKRRGALVLAELAGYSSTADAYHETSPSGEGMVRALKLAIGRIRLSDASVYVNAHATGTKGDESELKSIAEVLDRAQVAGISSTKGATGHMMGAAGAFEALVSIASLRRRQIPPSLKLDCPIDVAKDWPMSPFEATPAPDLNLAVNLSLGFGGLNAVTVWRRGEAA
jgi:3-oxoacyl-[acyl-carrier-protein] synthase II